MKIGGEDKVLEIPYSESLVSYTLQWMKTYWPEMTWERPRIRPLIRGAKAELHIYKDAAAKAAWNKQGGEIWNQETGVFLTFEADALCAVVAGKTADALNRLFTAIQSNTSLFI